MPRINLLPWRAELRQKRKKEFMVALAGSLIVAVGVIYLSKLTVQGWTSAQQGRNEVLRTEIAALEKQIQEISNLETQRDRLRGMGRQGRAWTRVGDRVGGALAG